MNPYDVKFVDSVGKIHGFMLAKSKEGLKTSSFVVQSKANIPQAFVTGSASYDNITPEKISPLFISDDWRKGFGDEDYTGRYHDADGTDGRFKNRIMLSPKKLTSVAFPASATTTVPVPNGGFEDWPTGTVNNDIATPNGWTNSSTGGSRIKCSTTKDSGVYAALLDFNVDGGAIIELNFPWDVSMRGKSVTVSFRGYEYADAVATGAIFDGVDTTTTNLAGAAYASYTITHTFNASATRFRLRFISNTADALIDTVTCTRSTTPYGSGVQAINFGSTLVVASGSTLLKSTNGTSFTTVCDFLAPITSMTVFGSNLYIANGITGWYWYTADLSTFTASTQYTGSAVKTVSKAAYAAGDTTIDVASTTGIVATNLLRWENEVVSVTSVTDADTLVIVRAREGTIAAFHASGTTLTLLGATSGAKYMANVSDTQFWITTGNNSMCDTDDPTNDGLPFSTVYTLPNSQYNITCLLDDPEGYVYVGKQDMPYVLSGADVVTLSADLAPLSSTAGVLLYKFKGDILIRTGANKLYRRTSDGTLQDLSPVNWAYGNPDYDEEIQAFCSDSAYLYIFMDNGSDIILLAGREETVDSTDWVWHPLDKFTEASEITSAVVSSVSGYPVIYALTGDSADGVLKWCCSASYGDTNLEVGYEFVGSGIHYSPWIVTNFTQHDKYWSELFVTGKNCDTLTSITAYYQIEGDEKTGTWRELGECEADTYVLDGNYKLTTSPKAQVTKFTIDETSRKLRLRFDLKVVGATDEVSPVITSYVVYGRVEDAIGGESTDKKDISLVLACHGPAPMRNGAIMERTSTGEVADLIALKASQKALQMYGFDGILRTVKFKSGDFGYQPDSNPTAGPTFAVTCRVEEV